MDSLFYTPLSFTSLIDIIVYLARKARKEGLPSLEMDLVRVDIASHLGELFKLSLQLVINGASPAIVKRVLFNDKQKTSEFLEYNWNVWRNLLLFMTEKDTDNRDAEEYLQAGLLLSHELNHRLETVLQDFIITVNGHQNPSELSMDRFPERLQAHPLSHSNLRLFLVSEKLTKDIFERTLEQQFHFYIKQYVRCMALIIDGVIMIQEGENEDSVKDVLVTAAGMDHIPEELKEPTNEELQERYNALVSNINGVHVTRNELKRRLEILDNNEWIRFVRN